MKKSIALTLVLTLFTSLFTILVLPVGAVSKTIFVPDDYPTISSAIGNATSGDVIFIKKGTYDEQTLEINKTLSIIGEDVKDTRIFLHPPVLNVTWMFGTSFAKLSNGITVVANDFRIHNLTIVLEPGGFLSVTGDNIRISGNDLTTGGSPTGLTVNGSYCNVTGNVFDGFISSNGKSNFIVGNSAFNILVVGESGVIGNNTIRQISLSNKTNNLIYKNQIGSPFRSQSESELVKEDSGIIIDGYSFNNTFFNNDVAAFTYNVKMDNRSENNVFYQNNFENNSRHTGIGILPSNFNFWDNGVIGNYWEDYNGTDADGDGIGDAPYVIDANNVDRYPLMSLWSGNLPERGIALPQALLPIIAVILLAVVFILIFYFKRRHSKSSEHKFNH